MEQSSADGGEPAAKRPKFSASSREDRLSALPEDILVLILLRLDTTAEAVRTGVLSSRWRRIWTLLPELTFSSGPDYRHIGEVLEAPVAPAPALSQIHVRTKDDSPEHLAAWLPLAARRLSGVLYYRTKARKEEVDGSIPLPCFGDATSIKLNLGFLPIALPSTGEFIRLAELNLKRVRFQDTCELGDVISSPRCPRLRRLCLCKTRGLVSLAISSDSLWVVDLRSIKGLLQLKIDASALKHLVLQGCFVRNRTIVDVSAPRLVALVWGDVYDQSSVVLGNLRKLKFLFLNKFLVYGKHGHLHSRYFVRFLQQFQFIKSLRIALTYRQEIDDSQYLMKDIKFLPNVESLTMLVKNEGHSFGSSSFHVLRLCTGIKRLTMLLNTHSELEAQGTCTSDCNCDPSNIWKTEELSLNCLQEVEISNLKGVEHEFAFLKHLLKWAIVLKKIEVTFNLHVSKRKAEEFCGRLSRFSSPKIRLESYLYRYSR